MICIKECMRIPVVMVPCSSWKLKWIKKMVLGEQCLKSIHGCPSSSCLAMKYFQQYFKWSCTANVVQVLTKKFTTWELSPFPLRALKRLHCFTIFWSTLSQDPKATADDQPALHKLLGLHTRTSWWVINGSAGPRPHFKSSFQFLYVSLLTINVKEQSMLTQR